MKGIILAGGKATRLMPLTKVTSKQLLPVYNKPMVFYPLNTLLQAGIKEVLIIIAPDYAGHFLHLLGSGREFKARFTYEIQEKPRGLADAFIIGKDFMDEDSVAMILGDNIFTDDLSKEIKSFEKGGRVFVKKVSDPERYGVVKFDQDNKAEKIVEKPKEWISDYAVTGLYVYDKRVCQFAKELKPSDRGEIEITDINNKYLELGELDVVPVKGEWFDTGTFDSLLAASNYVAKHNDSK
ncbi:MAG: spore coat protein [Candidatus Kerfeldbacteria bacterium CG08_land_8_20_14_0_20_40_16]|uniref:glucose-1-phosphate thymidylyltransferase n=1 Tax=Candidatus Kerfeldbacteria bacterium CG08_land_8_20_14_0_20_40_16 TaxID=2014244 RepID=A0A2H0YXP0_9BACT|nr:MAG: spore coat protein [Candidatus Kerfeldbacteria bacterium CG08_land_8_20_14_0_20_40_16]